MGRERQPGYERRDERALPASSIRPGKQVVALWRMGTSASPLGRHGPTRRWTRERAMSRHSVERRVGELLVYLRQVPTSTAGCNPSWVRTAPCQEPYPI